MKKFIVVSIAVSLLIFSGILLANGTDLFRGNSSTTNTPNHINQDMPMGRMNHDLSSQMPTDPSATGQNSMQNGMTGSTSGMGSRAVSGMGSGTGGGGMGGMCGHR